MKRFEYKSVKMEPKSIWSGEISIEDIDIELNNLGCEGWELVNVQDLAFAGSSYSYLYTFKRETI